MKEGRKETTRDIFLGALSLTMDDFINGLYNHLYEYINNIHSNVLTTEIVENRKIKGKLKNLLSPHHQLPGECFVERLDSSSDINFVLDLTTQHKNPILMKNIFYRFMPPQLSSESIGFSSRAPLKTATPTILCQMGMG